MHSEQASAARHLVQRIRRLRNLPKLYRNWPEVALFRLGLRARITLELKTGSSIQINGIAEYESLGNREAWNVALLSSHCGPVTVTDGQVEFVYRKRIIRLRHGSVPLYSNILREQFAEEQYRWLDVRGKDVLDIGGAIGDSAIYFALRGARHVFTLEPYPYTFKLLSENVELNNLKQKITPIRAAGGRDGTVAIAGDPADVLRSEITDHPGEAQAPTYSLASLVQRNGLVDAVAKIDCEGGEYPLVLDAEKQALRAFRQYMIEYHQGLSGLPEKLRSAGFQVSYTGPVYSRCSDTGQTWHGGMIRARRVD